MYTDIISLNYSFCVMFSSTTSHSSMSNLSSEFSSSVRFSESVSSVSSMTSPVTSSGIAITLFIPDTYKFVILHVVLVLMSVLTSTLLSVAPCIFHVCDKTAHALTCHISFINKGGLKQVFHFFHMRGGRILGGVQVICNMPFLMLHEGHKMAIQSVPGR